MALALPFLLLIMALIINAGHAVCWKVRALTFARHSIWGNLSPNLHSSPFVPYDRKTGFNDPHPGYWQAGDMSDGPADLGKAAEVTGYETPRQPVVRGQSDANPILEAGNGNRISVNADLLDPSRGVRSGTSKIVHDYPLLKRMARIDLHAENEIFDDAWRIAEMGIPNMHFRLNLIYPTFQPPGANNPVLPVLLKIYNSIYSQGQLALLYGTDPDFIKFQALYGQPIPTFINSIPGWTRLRFGCSMDPAVVKQAVDDLVERISGSKKDKGPLARLSKALKGYYQSVQGRIRTLMQATPPPSPAQLGQMQTDLATLDGYIRLIDQFTGSL